MPANNFSITRELWKSKFAIILYWDFLISLTMLGGLLLAELLLSPDNLAPVLEGVSRGVEHAPTLGLAALSLSIATLTFLSSIANNELFKSAARAGALTDFATFSWWEGCVALASVLFSLVLDMLPAKMLYVQAAISTYVLLGLLGLLLRLTHIVYRHAAALADQ